MKKTLIAVVTNIMVFTAAAQLGGGLKAGLNISKEKYSNTSVYTTSSHTFYCFGVYGTYDIGPNIGLEADILYSKEGTEESYMSGSSKINGVVTHNRLNIPVLFQYKALSGLYLETGPQAGLKLSVKGKYTDGVTTKNYDFTSNTNPLLFSWCFGAGYKFSKNIPGLGINLSYALGLNNLNKGTVNGGKLTGSTLSLRLLYGFLKAKKK
jgi:hypothetical protein